MSLDAVKPSKIQKRFKALFYGGPGLGKTLTAIKFPRPYVIDTEGGCENDEYVEILEKEEGALLKTLDSQLILSNIKSLLTEKHQYKTLVIDSLTYLYQSLLEEADANPRISEGFGGYYKYANKYIKKLILNVLKLDMNVIVICHSKDKYKVNGKEMDVEDRIADGPKDLGHMFDIALEISRNGNISSLSYANIKKSRVKGLKEGETIQFNYNEISSRYGKETFIKDSVPVKLATEEQVSQIENLIESLEIPFSTTNKWLKKANVDSFREMDEKTIIKCIEHLIKQGFKSKKEKEENEEDIPMKMAV